MLIEFLNESFASLVTDNLFANNEVILVGFVAFLSLCVGSYLNVVIFRTPIMSEINTTKVLKEEFDVERRLSDRARVVLESPNRSACLSCGEQLSVRDNIPLLSYLFSLGKCRHCSAKVSMQYPMVEALMMGIGTYSFIHYFDGYFSLSYLTCLLWVASGLVIAIIDFKEKEISDFHNFVHLASFTCFMSLTFGQDSLFSVVTDAGLVTCSFMVVALLVAKFKNESEGMGEGDLPIIFQSSCIVFFFNRDCASALNEGSMLCMVMFGLLICTAILKSFIDGNFDRKIPMAPSLVVANMYFLSTHFI